MRSALADRRWVVGAASVVLLLVAGLALWQCSAEDTYVAPTPAGPTSPIDAAAAAETLRQFQAAIETGDDAAAAALGATESASELLATAVANAADLRLEAVSMRYLSESNAPMAEAGWAGEVELTWRHRGFDRQAAARGSVEVGFADSGESIASVGAEDGLTPLWLQGRLAVRRGGGALVAALDPDAVDAHHRRARAAVIAVGEQLGGRPRLVVEVPADAAGLHRSIGSEAGTYDEIAAVTTGADGSVVPGTPLHVFLNPDVYDALDDLAAQVVMTHEAVHAVTEAPFGRSVPLWLLEGFADFVALRDVDLPVERKAAQVIEQVVEDGLPDALPGPADFDAATGHLGATYEAAWLVCELLAERGGPQELIEAYRVVLAGSDLAAELEQRFGWTEDDLLAAWQQRLEELSR